jgi:acyl-CoA thioesterase
MGGAGNDTARRSADAMWAEDRACQHLNMRIDAIAAGEATLSMQVTEAMTNGHGLCHGGYIFTLADSAFAYACNSYGQRTVAQQCNIAFIAPGRLGMRLSAEAKERQRAERSGIYDVTVRDESGAVIAEFRGFSRSIPGSLI